MIPCPTMREALLTAALPVLRGEGDDPLARHLSSCPACAAAAARILEETARLDTLLGSLPAEAPDVPALVRRAREAGAEAASAPSGRKPRRWRPLAAGALLAAAAAGLLLLTPGTPPAPPAAGGPAAEGPPPVVEAASSGGVAVLPTSDPDITVLWFF